MTSKSCPDCNMSQYHHCFPGSLKINNSQRRRKSLTITSNNIHSEISNTMKELNSQLETSLNSQSESNANLMKILREMQDQLDSFCRTTVR